MTKKESIEALKEHKQLLDKKYLKSRLGTAIETVLQALEQKDKEIQELKADLYECNNIISDYIDTVKEKDETIKQYRYMILEHKKQLNKSGIYGYDYDLKILESEEEDE